MWQQRSKREMRFAYLPYGKPPQVSAAGHEEHSELRQQHRAQALALHFACGSTQPTTTPLAAQRPYELSQKNTVCTIFSDSSRKNTANTFFNCFTGMRCASFAPSGAVSTPATAMVSRAGT